MAGLKRPGLALRNYFLFVCCCGLRRACALHRQKRSRAECKGRSPYVSHLPRAEQTSAGAGRTVEQATPQDLDRVAAKELSSSYYTGETLLITLPLRYA